MTRTLGWLALVGLVAGLVMAFGVAPRELTQGNVQRIMYIHVPAVWVAYLAFLVACGASIAYLLTRRVDADQLAESRRGGHGGRGTRESRASPSCS